MDDGTPIAERTLPRVLGPFDACMVVVGSVIGSGIFTKPGKIAVDVPAFGPIIGVWIVLGIVTLCGCLALAELAAMMPQAGGPFVYLRAAFGRPVAFLWGWTEFWVVRTGSIGALSAGTTIYLNEVLDHRLTHAMQGAVTVAIVVALSIINLVSTKKVALLQNFTAVVKVGFLVLIIALPWVMGRADTTNLQPIAPATYDAAFFRGLAAAMVAVLWAYDGWINIGPITEEIDRPQRNVPLALCVGIAIVTVTYVLANVSYHLVLPIGTMAGDERVASSVVRTMWGDTGAKVVALGVMCSMFGAVNSNMLTGPRIYFAMARDGLLPRAIRNIHHRYETPANAVLLQAVWTTILVIVTFAVSSKPFDAFNTLTDFVIFGGAIFYALAVAAVFVLRVRRPELPRPYRTWGYPVTPAIYLAAFLAAVASLLIASPKESLAGTLLIAAGVPFYFMLRGEKQAVQP